MMEKLLLEVKKIIETPDAEIDIERSATLLLRFNRNRILHQNLIRRRDISKLRYELQKVWNYRSSPKAQDEMPGLEHAAAVIIENTLPRAMNRYEVVGKGRRHDHDFLPPKIQSLFDDSISIYREMRKLHEHLKLLLNAQPCDRYPILNRLKSNDLRLRKNWDTYDSYVCSSSGSADQ